MTTQIDFKFDKFGHMSETSAGEMERMRPEWERFTEGNADAALACSFCLYVFHHPDDGDRPFYIGKAKYFGPKQKDGYAGGARYNAGYQHLLMGLLRAGFSVYIAQIGESAFKFAEEYEQGLIEHWNPVRKQKRKANRRAVDSVKPWTVAVGAETETP